MRLGLDVMQIASMALPRSQYEAADATWSRSREVGDAKATATRTPVPHEGFPAGGVVVSQRNWRRPPWETPGIVGNGFCCRHDCVCADGTPA